MLFFILFCFNGSESVLRAPWRVNTSIVLTVHILFADVNTEKVKNQGLWDLIKIFKLTINSCREVIC